jgi:hypothetical protein
LRNWEYQARSELTLKPSRSRYVWLLIGCLLFVAEGVYLVRHPPNQASLARMSFLMCWAGILFFGAGVVVFSVQLIPGSAYLKLDPAGFTICSLFKLHSYRWDEVDSFEVAGSRKSILCNFSRLHRSRRYFKLLDTYGMSAEKLAKTLNEWRQRSMETGPRPDSPR